MFRRTRAAAVLLAATTAAALTVGGCGSTSDVSGTSGTQSSLGFGDQICGQLMDTKPGYRDMIGTLAGGAHTLSGAGSTFMAPMMSDWAKLYNARPGGVQVSYQSIGSGGGVAQILARTVDFGASDTGMNAAELAKANGPVLQIPLLLGAVVPAYHLSGVVSGLKFTGDVLGRIYAGQITRWNDPALAALNPGVTLPNEAIAVVHRADGSGTTGIWTDFLTKESPQWITTLGGSDRSSGKTVAWPVGIGGKGNEGVSGVVDQTEGALGYLELQYALAQNTTYGQVLNRAGKYVQPCIATVTKAVNGISFPPSLNTSLTDGTDPDVYPIAGTTYALVYQRQRDPAKAAALVSFLGWVLTSGQDFNADLPYAPLGVGLQMLAVNQLRRVTVNGVPVAH